MAYCAANRLRDKARAIFPRYDKFITINISSAIGSHNTECFCYYTIFLNRSTINSTLFEISKASGCISLYLNFNRSLRSEIHRIGNIERFTNQSSTALRLNCKGRGDIFLIFVSSTGADVIVTNRLYVNSGISIAISDTDVSTTQLPTVKNHASRCWLCL